MLSDKAIENCLKPLSGLIDEWFVAPLLTARGASVSQLTAAFEVVGVASVVMLTTIEAAYQAASAEAVSGDRLIIFGSFVTVAKVKQFLKPVP
jgi:dihydrofolate synthase/folylpolyglutamate synthase